MIFIDSRVGSKELAEIPCLAPISTVTNIHPHGDVLIMGNGADGTIRKIAIEVKSIPDFVASIQTNRLTATQLPAMFESCDMAYVLVYGKIQKIRDGYEISLDGGRCWSKAYGGKIGTPETIQTIFAELEMAGVFVHLDPTKEKLADRIVTLHDLWSKPFGSHKLFKGFDVSCAPKRDDRKGLIPRWETDAQYNVARIAERLPGIGYTAMELASRHFRSVYDMMTAPRDRWERIENVGHITSRRILEFVLEGEPRER